MVKQQYYENRAVRTLEDDGYTVIRSAGSLGVFDLIAFKAGRPMRLIQVKKTQGPRRQERQRIKDFKNFTCPECAHDCSKKEIWVYKIDRYSGCSLKIEEI